VISFRKSSFSEQGDCVEVGKVELFGVRDSKDPEGPVLWFTRTEWEAFRKGMLAGEFD
jgi:hypothetical protein